MNRYTVQNSYTVNEIMISPTMNDKQKGSVVSLLNVTLEDANSQGENIPEVSNPRSLGGLVYTFDKPYSQSNEAGVRKSSQKKSMVMEIWTGSKGHLYTERRAAVKNPKAAAFTGTPIKWDVALPTKKQIWSRLRFFWRGFRVLAA
ncbi:hypothetical protein NQ318_003446 [Aromia moschata]|uniref:Vitellogenin domain-containing protein n=1 Tax=Aromia moschata TaxID=1265417 RepID=A0AAV8YWH7_9CUCU|nr:hypothetical protein NQ318_003446 [Aromia moschata]